MLAGTCGYWATWSTPFRSKPNCASWWKSWWSVEMISPSVRRWSSGERPVVALLFIWSSDLLALSSCGVHWVCLRNKMVEYLTDWVMGTSNQAADDDVKCLTRWKPHERHKIYPNQNWTAETGGPERNYVKTFSTSKGWKYGRLFVNQLRDCPWLLVTAFRLCSHSNRFPIHYTKVFVLHTEGFRLFQQMADHLNLCHSSERNKTALLKIWTQKIKIKFTVTSPLIRVFNFAAVFLKHRISICFIWPKSLLLFPFMYLLLGFTKT